MNLTAVKEQLLKLGEKVGLKVESETAEKLTVHTQMSAKGYFDQSIYLRVVIFSSGTLHMFITFEEMEKTYDNLFLINNFNSENPWFKAYIGNINGKDYLELHYASLALENEGQVTTTVGYLLNELLSENSLKYLKPILNSSK
jgi:hypothetical protein